ncbi:MAG: hypothetical protein J0I81_00275 [Hyphomicrobium sp.]|nr:hypothetical protein [Hyphomicrobium sp.]
MKVGADLRCEGRVSREQLARIEEAQDAWVMWRPDLFRKISIFADEEVGSVPPANRDAVLAYSGGLDATFALHAHCKGLLGRRQNNLRAGVMVHGFDVPLDRPDIFGKSSELGDKILESYGLPLTIVRTNWRDLRDMPWYTMYIFALSSVMHQFSGVVSRAVIAADEAYDGEYLGCGSNSITNPLMSHFGFPIEFAGGGYTRTSKAKVFSGNPVVLSNLRVCFQSPIDGHNCGRCEKCIRTKLNFIAAGIGRVPCLGNLPNRSEIDGVTIDNPAVLNLYRDILDSGGDWAGHEELRDAVRRIVFSSKWERSRRRLAETPAKLSRRLTRIYRKHILRKPDLWRNWIGG